MGDRRTKDGINGRNGGATQVIALLAIALALACASTASARDLSSSTATDDANIERSRLALNDPLAVELP